jgi:hypothetical protein
MDGTFMLHYCILTFAVMAVIQADGNPACEMDGAGTLAPCLERNRLQQMIVKTNEGARHQLVQLFLRQQPCQSKSSSS